MRRNVTLLALCLWTSRSLMRARAGSLENRWSLRPLLGRRAALEAGLAVLAAGAVPAAPAAAAAVAAESSEPSGYTPYSLVWEPKASLPPRTSVSSYQPRFITYLARFLLNFDAGSAAWFSEKSRDLPVRLDASTLRGIRERQYGAFAESVEVGLLKFQGRRGVGQLYSLMRSRYGTTAQAKVQIALLFSLIAPANQPSELIRRALGEADAGSVAKLALESGGAGYTGSSPPAVTVAPPDGGSANGGGLAARASALLKVTGTVRSLELTDGGGGYLTGVSPAVSISPPLDGGEPAQAIAAPAKGGKVRGRVRGSSTCPLTVGTFTDDGGHFSKGGPRQPHLCGVGVH